MDEANGPTEKEKQERKKRKRGRKRARNDGVSDRGEVGSWEMKMGKGVTGGKAGKEWVLLWDIKQGGEEGRVAHGQRFVVV